MIYLNKNAGGMIADELCTGMAHAGPAALIENVRIASAEILIGSLPEEIVLISDSVLLMSSVLSAALSARPDKTHVITTLGASTEIIQCFAEEEAKNGCRVSFIGLNVDGTPDIDSFCSTLDPETAFVSLPIANEETGAIFPVEELTEIVRRYSNALVHVDVGSSVGFAKTEVGKADLVSFSLDSSGQSNSVRAVYVRKNSGIYLSESSDAINDVKRLAGFYATAKLAADLSQTEQITKLRDRLENGLVSIDAAYINGRGKRLPNISNISFEDVNGEAILSRLYDQGVVADTSSACASPGHLPSTIFQSMDVPYSRAMGSIRFTLNRYTTEAEIDHVIGIMPAIVKDLRFIRHL